MSASSVKKIVRGALRRIVQRTRIRVLRASCDVADVAPPAGYTLVRTTGNNGLADPQLIEAAMRGAGEPDGLVARRLDHGDQFFGWRIDGEIVSFGWACDRDRSVGPIRLCEASGRMFLFNFHTAVAHRGHGLYPALLIAVQNVLGSEGCTEVIIDVNVSNTISARAIEQARFVPVGQVCFTTIFGRWRHVPAQPALDLSGPLSC